MADEIIGTCGECDREIAESDDFYCSKCFEDAAEALAEAIAAEPEYGVCRVCANVRYLNAEGYCSPDCTRGLTKVEDYAQEMKDALGWHGKGRE
jgi:hypothetical protein